MSDRCRRHPEREAEFALVEHYIYHPGDWRTTVRSGDVHGGFCGECRSEFLNWSCYPAPKPAPGGPVFEPEPETFMFKGADKKSFRCECGCNVFSHKLGSFYTCNACGAEYVRETPDPLPPKFDSNKWAQERADRQRERTAWPA